jgi:hypothetical protein
MRNESSDFGSGAGRAAAVALLPIVRALVADGVGAGEAARIVRRLYVFQVRSDLVSSGKRASIAAISAITGLTRLEVRQHLANSACRQPWHDSRLARVMSGWRSDPEFLDDIGRPAQLRYAARPRGFVRLVSKHAGDVPPRAVLNQLLDRHMVVRTGETYSLSDDVGPDMRRSATEALAQILPAVADTILHNRSAGPLNKRFQGITVSEVPANACERIGRQLGGLANAFVTRAAAYLERRSVNVSALSETRPRRVGVIAVSIEGCSPDDPPVA